MKLSKEELKQKITEVIEDEDTQISLLEDIEDSFIENIDNSETVEKQAYDDLKIKYDDLKSKYKERFLKGEEMPEDNTEKNDEGMKKEEVVDIKEI